MWRIVLAYLIAYGIPLAAAAATYRAAMRRINDMTKETK